MGVSSKTIRLFISSTFSDFQWERDVLHERVFPELGQLCRAHGVDFQPVDLRWGIREEEAREQRTLAICLREVRRCQALSPMPNFLILLGERYGWQPLPEFIPEEDFHCFKAHISGRKPRDGQLSPHESLALLNNWYRRDFNDTNPGLRLQPCRDGVDGDWSQVESSLRKIFRECAIDLKWSGERVERYFLSATHQEILLGTSEEFPHSRQIRDHVFCFQRRRVAARPNSKLEHSAVFNDVRENGAPDEDARARLSQLSQVLQERLGNNFMTYQAFAQGIDDISKQHLEAFAQDARVVLTAVVQAELARLANIAELEQERLRHEFFLHKKLGSFIGRESMLGHFSRTLTGGKAIVIHGPGGMGKSSMVAKTTELGSKGGAIPIYRFTGLTAAASSGINLLRSLCEEMAGKSGESLGARKDITGWGEEFRLQMMSLGRSSSQRYLIAIDALDQLPERDPARDLAWLPKNIPENVVLLLSTTDGQMLKACEERFTQVEFHKLEGLEVEEGRELLKEWLAAEKRQLQPMQIKHVLDQFRNDGSPLYLRLATQEARHWTAYDGPESVSGELPANTETLIGQIFNRLALPQNHGDAMVGHTLGYLAAARNGLTENELMGALSLDQCVMEQFRKDSPQGSALKSLPFIVWSRLRDDLEAYLSEGLADGFSAISFFHRIFREAVEKRFLGNPSERRNFHLALANYFSSGDHSGNFLHRDGEKVPNRRRLSELAFHLVQAGESQRLYNLLTDKGYFEAKLMAGQRYEVFSEYLACYEKIPPSGAGSRQAAKLARHLATQIIEHCSHPSGSLDLEDVHAYLAFQKDTRLYRMVLDEGLRQLAAGAKQSDLKLGILSLGMQARKGNLLRRDGQLGRAKRLLAGICLDLQETGPSAELSRVLYDLGYINYLEGDLEKSVQLLSESAEIARISGNETGSWISRCVAAQHLWLSKWTIEQADACDRELESVLLQAEEIFEQKKNFDSTSERWVMNIWSIRFNSAYRREDAKSAEAIYRKLENDPWLKGFREDIAIERFKAKLTILGGEYLSGAIVLESLAEKRLARSKKEESLAEDLAESGLAFVHAGKTEAARRVWQIALDLTPSCGNRYWQRIVKVWKKQHLN
jgi:hypothetical protein